VVRDGDRLAVFDPIVQLGQVRPGFGRTVGVREASAF
jgi:hypothetical protein